MQVFLPYSDLSSSVRCLDKSRLGNQVWREAKTLISGGWRHHPVAKLWADYKPCLAWYCLNGIEELRAKRWIRPEKADALEVYFWGVISDYGPEIKIPWWIDDTTHFDRVVESHRKNLLFKDPAYYSTFGWGPIPESKPAYYWPERT
jgi:hypothetical protein